MVKCAKVERQNADKALQEIKKIGLFENKYRIERDENFVYIPLKEIVDRFTILAERHIDIVEMELERSFERPKHYSELLSLPPEIKAKLPSSFDIVGDIAIIKLVEIIKPYEKEIGNALIKAHPSIKTVLADEGVEGDFRVRKVRFVAGEKKTITLHKEYGLVFEVDLAKVYFSPRLANERQFVCSEIVSPSVVIDMFAGIGPFSITIAKKHPEASVYAIDKNPDAYTLLLKNIARNHIKNVFPACGDAVAEIQKLPDADYIIMNLPHSAEKFLLDAIKKLKKNGKIFLYTICERTEIEKKAEEIKRNVRGEGMESSVEYHEVHTYSPTSSVFGLVIRVSS